MSKAKRFWLAFLAGLVATGWFLREWIKMILNPPRKSEAKEQAEQLNDEIQKRHDARLAEVQKELESIRESREKKEEQDPVDWANEIIKRN